MEQLRQTQAEIARGAAAHELSTASAGAVGVATHREFAGGLPMKSRTPSQVIAGLDFKPPGWSPSRSFVIGSSEVIGPVRLPAAVVRELAEGPAKVAGEAGLSIAAGALAQARNRTGVPPVSPASYFSKEVSR